MPESSGRATLIVYEDNEAVIRKCIKGRSPNLRHVQSTHRANLDWLFQRIRKDKGIAMRYINTNWQIADMLTKGQLTAQLWKRLCELASIRPSIEDSQSNQPINQPKAVVSSAMPTTRSKSNVKTTLTVGTDCSGIEIPIQSMENMNISFRHKFRSEIDPKAREIVSTYFKPDILYHDVTTRDTSKVFHVDISNRISMSTIFNSWKTARLCRRTKQRYHHISHYQMHTQAQT